MPGSPLLRKPHYVATGAGRFTAAALAARLPRLAWQRLKTGQGSKGDRHYDWAMIEVTADDTPPGDTAGHTLLLVRRHRYTCELSFYRCHSAAAVALSDLVAVVCRRWRIEEDFQAAKSLSGLDQGQATCWNSWMRWSLISMIAYTILAVTTARSRAVIPASSEAKLIPLTPVNCSPCCEPPSCPSPGRISPTSCTGHSGDAVTSTEPPHATATGTKSPQR
jgi:hypothetical protein